VLRKAISIYSKNIDAGHFGAKERKEKYEKRLEKLVQSHPELKI
jgi:hypothetical protein